MKESSAEYLYILTGILKDKGLSDEKISEIINRIYNSVYKGEKDNGCSNKSNESAR